MSLISVHLFQCVYGLNLYAFDSTAVGTNVYGVSPNFFEVVLPGFLVVGEMEGPESSLVDQLYTAKGSSSAILGTLYQTLLGISHIGSHFLLEFQCADLHPRPHGPPSCFLSILSPVSSGLSRASYAHARTHIKH